MLRLNPTSPANERSREKGSRLSPRCSGTTKERERLADKTTIEDTGPSTTRADGESGSQGAWVAFGMPSGEWGGFAKAKKDSRLIAVWLRSGGWLREAPNWPYRDLSGLNRHDPMPMQ